MITTVLVRARIVTALEFRIGNERRESRRDYNRDGGVERVRLAVASTALNERGGAESETWTSVLYAAWSVSAGYSAYS
jgi:hypothetical protein